MAQHLIWTAGLLGHLVLVAVLAFRGRWRRFPFFTALILFDIVRALALAMVLGHFLPHSLSLAVTIFELTDLVLEFGVLAELVFTALAPLGRLRLASLGLLLFASGVVIVMRVAPVRHYTTRAAAPLLHFLLAVLFVEWSVILAFFLRSLELRWRGAAAAISFGFGVYSAALLFAGGYFRVGRDMSDYIFFSYFRIGIYLVVVLWWIVNLWSARPERETQIPVPFGPSGPAKGTAS